MELYVEHYQVLIRGVKSGNIVSPLPSLSQPSLSRIPALSEEEGRGREERGKGRRESEGRGDESEGRDSFFLHMLSLQGLFVCEETLKKF